MLDRIWQEKSLIQGHLVKVMLLEGNPYSMFLKAVEKEILDIVTNCKNKKSTDLNEIDMTLVMKVFVGISKPLTFI